MPSCLPAAFMPHSPFIAGCSVRQTARTPHPTFAQPADPPSSLSAPFVRQSASKVWLALNNHDLVPEFGPDEAEEPMPPPHFSLNQQIDELRHLPTWKHFQTIGPKGNGVVGPDGSTADFHERMDHAQTTVRAEFRRALSEARLLAHHLFGMWGDHQAMTLLQLAGKGAVIKAHDEGNTECLKLCGLAWCLAEADSAVRACLADLAENQPSVADAVAGFYSPKEAEFYKLALGLKIAPRDAEILNAASPHASSLYPVFWVNSGHPRWRADSLLPESSKLYLNPDIKGLLGVEDIARQLGEPVDHAHLECHYTLTEGAALYVARQAFKHPLSNTWPVHKGKCMAAFEQACRAFGERELLVLLFGWSASDFDRGDPQGANAEQKIFVKELLPAVKGFLQGKEADWA